LREDILIVHLGTNFISAVDAQISMSPRRKFVITGRQKKKERNLKQNTEKNAPQRSGSFDDDLFLGIREAADQRPYDVLSLQEATRRRVVMYQIRDGDTCPLALNGVGVLDLKPPPGKRFVP